MKNAYNHLVDYALAQGFVISVYDGEEWQVTASKIKAKIIDAIESVESCNITIRKVTNHTGNIIENSVIVGSAFIVQDVADDEKVADYSESVFMVNWAIDFQIAWDTRNAAA